MENFKKFAYKLGKRITKIRLIKNISLEVLALDTKIDITTLEEIEAGSENSYLDEIVTISQGLNVEMSDLFSDKPFTF